MEDEKMATVNFEHLVEGRMQKAKANQSMTGEQIVEDLIEQGFMKHAEEGYELFVKGGADISLDKPLSTQ